MASIVTKQMIQMTIKIGINTLILLLPLKKIIKGQNVTKIFALAFSIAIPSIHGWQTIYSQYLGAQIQFKNHIYFYFIFAIQFYLLYIATISQIVDKVKNAMGQQINVKIRNIINRILLYLSLLYLIIIAIYFFSIFSIQKIFNISNFIAVCIILICSFSLLVMVSIVINRVIESQVIRRKIFHIGPILVIPIISYYNHSLLRIILAPAFFLLLILEVIRYNFFRSFTFQKQKVEPQGQNQQKPSNSQVHLPIEETEQHSSFSKIQDLNAFEKLMKSIFTWMGSMNKRQKGFWFTHLYLTLSLLCAYQFELMFSSRMKLNGHIVLILLGADGIAAIIGSKFGRIRLYGNKTLQGFLAFFVICFVVSKLIIPLNSYQLALISFGAALAELYSGDLDNITTLFMYYLIRYVLVIIVRIKHS